MKKEYQHFCKSSQQQGALWLDCINTKWGLRHSSPCFLHVCLACKNSCHHPSGAQSLHPEHLLCYPSVHSLHGSFHIDLSICLYHFSCSPCLLFIPSFHLYLIYAACCIYIHLHPTPPLLTFFHFHVCNLGLPPPAIPLLLISSAKGPVCTAVQKNQARTVCQMWSHIFKLSL